MLKALLGQLFPKREEASPSPGDAPLQRAAALIGQRQWEAAARLTEEILGVEPENVEALLLHARSCRARGLLSEAQQAYRRALTIEPRRADAWLDLGVCHHMIGDDFWARIYFRFARELDPNNAQVWNEFGVVEIRLGNFEQAEQSLGNAVNHDPGLAEAWNNLGLVLARRGDLANARRHFLRATFLKPQYYMAQCNLGLACRELELEEEATKALRNAIEIDPSKHTAWVNLAMVMQDQGRLEEALDMLERARVTAPTNADVLAALSAVQLRRGVVDEALNAARQALVLDPQNAEAELALSHAHLAIGDFTDGWKHYEARLRDRHSPVARLGATPWQGEVLSGKSLVVYGEQGLGDEIMFASCLTDVSALADRCALVCNPRLATLFRRSFPEIEVFANAAELERQCNVSGQRIDYSAAIGSLPLHFRTRLEDFPARVSYLRADETRTQAWRERLAALGPGLKVGIAWRGGLLRTGRVHRSVDFAQITSLLETPRVHWVSLQHQRSPEESDPRIAAWDDATADPDEIASLMSALDLIVTVCSTVVHLAGALGRPVWVLTPKAPAWRYLLEGERLPWYPSARLFRQDTAGQWTDVLARVATELERLAQAGK